MLSTSEVEMLIVDDQALMAIPEEIARANDILPVARDKSRLHLVIPASTPEQEESLVDDIRYYVVEDEITYQTAALIDLSPKVDFFYSRLNSTVNQCGRRFLFRFRCPKVWASLTPTSAPAIRFCGVCNKNVYYASTEDELEQHSRAGRCTAFFDRNKDVEFLGELL